MASLNSLTTVETVTLILALTLGAILFAIGYQAWKRSRVTPEERERLRRDALVAEGKMGDATLMEVRDDFLVYSYNVRGIEYTASQEIAVLKQHVPSDLSALASVSVKYDPRNPANSIVLAEHWSGLHMRKVG